MEPTERIESRTTRGAGDVERELIWQRGFFMLLFVVLYAVAEAVVAVVAVVQFGWIVLAEERNARLEQLGRSVSRYIYQVVRFWTFVSEEKPFPFSDWPGPDTQSEQDRVAGF